MLHVTTERRDPHGTRRDFHLDDDLDLIRQVEERLSHSTAKAYRRSIQAQERSPEELGKRTERYLEELRTRAARSEFLDLSTATQVARGCLELVRRLGESPEASRHRVVQAAVDYFTLEDDAEADSSIVGFDDDLEVLLVTATVLGWDLPEDDA